MFLASTITSTISGSCGVTASNPPEWLINVSGKLVTVLKFFPPFTDWIKINLLAEFFVKAYTVSL